MASRVLAENGLDESRLLQLIQDYIVPEVSVIIKERESYSPKAKILLEEAGRQAERFHSDLVGTEHLLLAMIKESDNVAVRLLTTMGMSAQKIYADTLYAIGEDPNLYKTDLAKGRGQQKKKGSTLEQYSRDLTALAKEGKLDPVVGREAEIQRVIQIISRRTKNNPCLIGEPGVGKTAVVEGLAQRIVTGNVPFTIQDKRVLVLDLSGMVAGSKYRGEFEERIKKVIAEVIAGGNVLLFLDELHTLIGAGGAEGAIDASNILKPSLARGEIQLIGATTIEEYRKYYEEMNPATAEYLYKQVIQQSEESKKISEYVESYSSMKPASAAAIFAQMTDNLDLVSRILGAMDSEKRGSILAAMDPELASRLTKMMDPES